MRPRVFREMTRHRAGRKGETDEQAGGRAGGGKKKKKRAVAVERNGRTRALECFERPRAALLARAARWL